MMDEKQIKTVDIAGFLAKKFLKNPLTPLLGASLLLLGYLALMITPREEDPQMAVSGGAIIVAVPGLSPTEIERVVVRPLERKIREIKGVENIHSVAKEDVAIVNVQYFIGQDRESSNLKLYDKVMQNMDMLPSGAMQPLVKPFDIDIDIPIFTVAFYNKGKQESIATLYKEVEKIQHRINAMQNVSKTTLKGEKKQQYNIEVKLSSLSAYNLSLGQIKNALQSLNVKLPNIKAKSKTKNLLVFGTKDTITTAKELENLIVASYAGSVIYLKDIATVTRSQDIQNFKTAHISYKTSAQNWDSKQQITLNISKLKGTNAVFIAQDIKNYLQKIKPQLEEKEIGYVITRNYGKRANEAVNELVFHLVISIVIIALLLTFVLGWRESVIVTFTVPAILAVTLFIAFLGDQTINRITLFAFLLSLGLLVDAAIIVIENIHRHLHSVETKNLEMDQIVVQATDEIGAPTNVATLAIILTMIPMAFVGQMMGQFMKPIPLNVPVALLASLLIAYIFTPYLAKRMLKKPSVNEKKQQEQDDA